MTIWSVCTGNKEEYLMNCYEFVLLPLSSNDCDGGSNTNGTNATNGSSCEDSDSNSTNSTNSTDGTDNGVGVGVPDERYTYGKIQRGGKSVDLSKVPLLVSWISDAETLKITTNGSIPAGTGIHLTFDKADFPLQ